MGHALATFDLTKVYHHQRGLFDRLGGARPAPKVAVNGVTFAVEEGEVFGLLGPNGSGKTTLLKMLSTILFPTSGTAKVLGMDVSTHGQDVRRLVALVTGDERSFYWRLSARQNLTFFAFLYETDPQRVNRTVDSLLELLDLKEVADVRVGEFSSGMKQKLAIARGLLCSPKLLFLDEPTRALDPLAAHELLNIVKERVVDFHDRTVVLTTHIMREVEQLCRNVTILRQGTVIYSGTVEALRRSRNQRDHYRIRAVDLEARTIERVRAIPGVEDCTVSTEIDGAIDLDLRLARDGGALAATLRCLLDGRGTITDCTHRETTFEETFRALFQDRPAGIENAPSAGVTGG